MNFEDQIRQIKKLAGITESDVDSSFLGRRQVQMQQDREDTVETIQKELQDKRKMRTQFEARIATILHDEAILNVKKARLLHPEATGGMSEEELMADYLESQNFKSWVESSLINIGQQVRLMLEKR